MTAQHSDTKALKSGLWYIVSNFVVKGAAFLSTPIFARLMSMDDIGKFADIGAWIQILLIITSLELATSITLGRFEYPLQLDEFVSSVLLLNTITSVTIYAIVLFFKDFFLELFKVDIITLHIMMLYCVFSPALEMIQIKNRVKFEYKLSTILSISSVLLSIVFSILLVISFENKLHGRLFGYYGFLILFNLGVYIYLLWSGKTITRKYWKFALSISIPMLVHALSGQLLVSCDRIMITRICGTSDNALYSVAYTAATVISVLWTSMHNAWSPWAYEQMDTGAVDRLKKASKPYILLFFAIVLCFLLVAPELMMIMGGEEYQTAVVVIPPVAIGIFFQFAYSIYVNIEFFYKKQKYTAVGTTIAAVINVILNLIFIPVFGYAAAAFTTLAGYVALFFIHFFIVFRMGKSTWFDTRYNIAILTLSVLTIPVLYILYNHNVIRWMIILLIFCTGVFLAIRFRKEIMSCVRKKTIRPIIEAFQSLTGKRSTI